jgi:DNA-binding LacI/PurR family transcriptional regulator
MAQAERPDAILCASDDLAAGAILGLTELGLKVPRDVAIVGFDDRPFAAHLAIPLTTVALPLLEMGEVAARRMFAALSGEQVENELIRVPCRLVIRASCGGAA